MPSTQRSAPRGGAARRLLGTQHSVLGTRGLPSDRSSAGGFRFCFTPRTGVLFTVPSRYCALSVAAALQPWGVGAPASRRVPRARRYSRATPEARPAAYRALTVCGGPSQGPSARGGLAHSAGGRPPPAGGRATPPRHRPAGHSGATVWAGPGSLAATAGISGLISREGVLGCFRSPPRP